MTTKMMRPARMSVPPRDRFVGTEVQERQKPFDLLVNDDLPLHLGQDVVHDLAADQPFRVSDIAIDICEDVEPLPQDDVDTLVDLLTTAGATVKVSSIHINAWIGDFTKREMSERFFREYLGVEAAAAMAGIVYVGDSPNDAPMFEVFEMTVGVANVADYADRMTHLPRWITAGRGSHGFCELAAAILGE